MMTAWIILQIAVGGHLVVPFIMFLMHRIFVRKQAQTKSETAEADYAIIITAYEQTDALPAVVDSVLKLNYSNYLVYVVADKCDISNLHFNNDKVVLLRPEETLAGNIKSHFYAIERFRRNHERITIIDSDNLVQSDYLHHLNTFFNRGYMAVQGVRKAKNTDTVISKLDAARDIYYHYYDGTLLFELGSSATLAGSGMAFTLSLYKECLANARMQGAGFDKVLQYEIVRRKHRIAFSEQAVVWDEKTSQTQQLVSQRARWINTWFKYFHYGFSLVAAGLKNGSFNQFLFGFILLRPPLFMFLIAGLFMMAANIFIQPLAVAVWGVAYLIFLAGFFIALMMNGASKEIYSALYKIPVFMFYQIVSLFKSHNASKKSVATRHIHTESKLKENEN